MNEPKTKIRLLRVALEGLGDPSPVGGEDHESVTVGRTPNTQDLREELAALLRSYELSQAQPELVSAVPPLGSPSSRSWR